MFFTAEPQRELLNNILFNLIIKNFISTYNHIEITNDIFYIVILYSISKSGVYFTLIAHLSLA